MAESDTGATKGAVNLLALDGGGIRGISELLILDEVMRRIQHDLRLTVLPRPCEYFHLIGGTSTGGLIALMLGRLRMSTDEALKAYNDPAATIFSESNRKLRFVQDGQYKATTLETQIKAIVRDKNLGERMLLPQQPSGTGNSFVCAVPANDMTSVRLFRTYPVRELSSINCNIWEAARATTAAPPFFRRIAISEPGRPAEEFVDGALRCNNPVRQVLEEAKVCFGSDRTLGCVVSIGTGHRGTIRYSKPDRFQKILPTKLIDALARITTDGQQIALELKKHFRDCPGVYFRFNVEHGAENVSLEEWKQMGRLTEHTKAYMADFQVSKEIDDLVSVLCQQRHSGITLGNINDVPRSSNARTHPQTSVRPKPLPSPIFTGRQDFMRKLDSYFDVRTRPRPRREFLLHGLGGVGKTQIALKFSRDFGARFARIFWIDGTSRITAEQSYKNITVREQVAENEGDGPIDAALHWLSTLDQEWLLLFDGCDDHDQLDDLLPSGDTGSIIFTSRNPGLRHPLPTEAISEVSDMQDTEAVGFLLRATHADDTEEHRGPARRVADLLGRLPLAIDIAGAAIYNGVCALDDYEETFRLHRNKLLDNTAYQGASRYNKAVYASWNVSFDAIQRSAQDRRGGQRSRDARTAIQLLNMMTFLHNQDIMEDMFKYAAENDTGFKYVSQRVDAGDKHQDFWCFLQLDKQKTWDSFNFRRGISVLRSFSLIKQDEPQRSFSLHALVSSWSRDRMSDELRAHSLYNALALLSWSGAWDFGARYYRHRRRLYAHVVACKQHCGARWKDLVGSIESESYIALIFTEAKQLDAAEELEEQVLVRNRKTLGDAHEDSLFSMENLASTYMDRMKWDKAEELTTKVLEILTPTLGDAHGDTLRPLSTLAVIHRRKGKLAEAEELGTRVLNLQRSILGDTHPNTLATINSMARLNSELGRSEEAEKLDRELLATRTAILGPKHPDTLSTMGNLAVMCQKQGRIDEAEKMGAQLYADRVTVLGEKHLHTMEAMHNLATLHKRRGRFEEAGSLRFQLLAYQREVLGRTNELTLINPKALIAVLLDQGRPDEAREVLAELLEDQRASLGPEDPATLCSTGQLAVLHMNVGGYEEAERLQVPLLADRSRILGPAHHDTLATMYRLACTLYHTGRQQEGIDLMGTCHERLEQTLGVDDAFTLEARRQLSEWTQATTEQNLSEAGTFVGVDSLEHGEPETSTRASDQDSLVAHSAASALVGVKAGNETSDLDTHVRDFTVK